MNALIGFVALIAVGLVGWAIAEFKYKAFTSCAKTQPMVITP